MPGKPQEPKRNINIATSFGTIETLTDKEGKESPVEELERLYPELADNFRLALNLQYILFAEKHLAYGFENISLGGDLSKPKANKFSLTGLWFRLNDKMNRFKNIAINDASNHVKDESMLDTFMDMANYAIIAKLVSQDKWK
jgi:hypothetical protein